MNPVEFGDKWLRWPRLEGWDVKKLNLHDIYILGKRIAPLGDLDPDNKIGPHLFPLWWARNALREAADPESPFLEVTKRAARNAVSEITAVIPDDLEKMLEIDREGILGYGGHKIKRSIEAFESVLSNEMPGVPAYIVSQKGIYRTEDLIDNAYKHLSPSVIYRLPAQAKADFCDAGKCLAFELPVACSFHLWRAVETVTGVYYETITGKTFDDDKVSKNWGAQIKALEAAGADRRITEFLDHIREEYRNPQTHPDEVVELQEAQTLFGTAASSINQMLLAIEKLKASGRQLSVLALAAPTGRT